jgi:hypothetical protein
LVRARKRTGKMRKRSKRMKVRRETMTVGRMDIVGAVLESSGGWKSAKISNAEMAMMTMSDEGQR